MQPSLAMARPKPPAAPSKAKAEPPADDDEEPKQPPAPSYFASTKYKLWLRKQIEDKKKKDPAGWTLKEIAKKLIRIDPNANATDGSIGLLLGSKERIPHGSNTTLMPALNKLFRIAPPPECDPEDPIAQLHDALAARWPHLTPTERAMLELMAKGKENDEG